MASAGVSVSARRGEAIAAVALVLLSAGLLVMALKMPFGTLASPGPGMFPLGLAALLGLVSIGLLLRALRLAGAPAAERIVFGHKQIWITLLALTGMGLLFEPLGYLLSTGLFMLVLLRSYSTLRWLPACATAAAVAAVSWAFFAKLLGVNLPLGLLNFN